MAGCIVVKDNEGNLGGAIFNDGKVTMFDTSNFFDNNSAVRYGTKAVDYSPGDMCSAARGLIFRELMISGSDLFYFRISINALTG